ncbi:MAG TPA: hypothetical protein VHO24_15315 [Opitutaceae bacterium]|nr:hypothetical protein [Opitutaceae bacterium]
MNRLIFALLTATLLLSSGCLFSKKTKKPRENSSIAADTDESFRQRFLDRRVAELTATGQNADAARAQAAEEFKTRYGYTSAAKK